MMNKELVKQCAKGNRHAQIELYRLYSGMIFNSTLRIVGNSQEAEEIMQDTLLKFLENSGKYIEVFDKVEYILRRMAINASIDLVRKRKGFFVGVEEISDVVYDDDSTDTFYDFERVKTIIKLLPERERILLSLKFKEGLSHRDIAEMFKTTEAAIKMLFMRTKQRVNSLYNKKDL